MTTPPPAAGNLPLPPGRNRTDFYKLLNRYGVNSSEFKARTQQSTPRIESGPVHAAQ